MSVRTLVDGSPADSVSVADRGLAYGDGVFETMLVADGRPVWWDAHLARLRRGCEALAIAMPDPEPLHADVASLAAGVVSAVLKLTVTRGASTRGYAAAGGLPPTRIASLHSWSGPDPAAASGIAARWCALRLALQPRLAGIKHLNRLEQVLARAEWNDAGIQEGLLQDTEGGVVSATAANLFVVRAGRVRTPALDRCGVAGVCREWVLAHREVGVGTISRADVEGADELFLSSSLRGILPVARLDGRTWTPGPMTRRLQQDLWREVPALRPADAVPA